MATVVKPAEHPEPLTRRSSETSQFLPSFPQKVGEQEKAHASYPFSKSLGRVTVKEELQFSREAALRASGGVLIILKPAKEARDRCIERGGAWSASLYERREERLFACYRGNSKGCFFYLAGLRLILFARGEQAHGRGGQRVVSAFLCCAAYYFCSPRRT